MPSFSCQVLLAPRSGGDSARLRDAVYAALAPYDAALEVDEYDRRCYCTDGGGAANPACPSCEGSGTYRSVYNPQAKWEVVLGGRGFPVALWPVAELLADPTAEVPAAVVTPDGAWHERGGATAEAWVAMVRALHNAHRGSMAVMVDLYL